MSIERNSLSRRRFIAAAAGTAGALASAQLFGQSRPTQPASAPSTRAAGEQDFCFFVIGDTHYLADKEHPDRLDPRSQPVTTRLIDVLNELPGSSIPDAAGGGIVGAPLGLIHAGDLIDSGDKADGVFPEMQQAEWQAYVRDFGLDGKDGRLRFPVYEVHGNHDSPTGEGIAISSIVQRNKTRPSVTDRSTNDLHYSWDWGGVHFVNLGIVVGAIKAVTRKRRYNALDSLEFLTSDLARNVGTTGRPVVITHHVDVARYTGPCDPAAAFENKEWDGCDVRAYYDAIKGYEVIAIFHGHTHARNILAWDGASTLVRRGINIFNVTQASHFGSPNHAVFFCRINSDAIQVREYATTDNWQTAQWSPKVWASPLRSAQS